MKCNVFILLTFLSFCTLKSEAQKEGNVWCFPDSLRMDFNGIATPVVSTSGVGKTGAGFPYENLSTIADSAGSLICYSMASDYSFSALTVFDKSHSKMPNGSGLHGHPYEVSIMLPFPGKDSLITLFHIGRDSVNTNNFGLFYSRINKTLRGGLGDVTLRDSLVYYGTLGQFKLATCRHGNGRDWWIFATDYTSNTFIYFLLAPSGISSAFTQNIGSNAMYGGKMVFSNDGTKLLSVEVNGKIDLFDFDRCSGVLSNFRDIGEHLTGEQYQYFSAAFSPNGNVIYISPWNLTKVFYQFDLNAPNITASKFLVNQYLDTGIVQYNTYQWHNLGPDGKIYIPKNNNYGLNSKTNYTAHLDIIEYPDSVGAACNYIVNGFNLGNHYAQGALPNMPYYGLGRWVGSPCDTITSIENPDPIIEGLSIFPNPTKGIFSVRLNNVNDKVSEINVHDVIGKKVFETTNAISSIDLSTKEAGVYFVTIETQQEKRYVVKVVKE